MTSENTTPPAHDKNSPTGILGVVGLVSAATLINVIFGFARLKVFAILLGPAGVGLTGLLYSWIQMGGALANFGISSSSIRRLADQENDLKAQAHSRMVMILTAGVFGVLGIVLSILFRHQIVALLGPDELTPTMVVLSGFGIAATVFMLTCTGIMLGDRRTRDFALAGIISTAIGSVIAVILVMLYGIAVVPLSVNMIPITQAVLYLFYALRRADLTWIGWRACWVEWRVLISVGTVFFITAGLHNITMVAVRAITVHDIDLAAAGYFHIAFLLSVTYVSFLQQSINADYLPRTTGLRNNPGALTAAIDQQIRLTMSLAIPGMIILIGFSDLAIRILVSKELLPAAEVMRWQILGDLVRVSSMCIAYIFISMGKYYRYTIGVIIYSILYVAFAKIFAQDFGVAWVGVSYLLAYVIYLIVQFFQARGVVKIHLTPLTFRLLIINGTLLGLTWIGAEVGTVPGMILGALCGAISTVIALQIILRDVPENSRIHRIGSRFLGMVPKAVIKCIPFGKDAG